MEGSWDFAESGQRSKEGETRLRNRYAPSRRGVEEIQSATSLSGGYTNTRNLPVLHSHTGAKRWWTHDSWNRGKWGEVAIPTYTYVEGVAEVVEKTELGYAIGIGTTNAIHYFFSENPLPIGSKVTVRVTYTPYKREDTITIETEAEITWVPYQVVSKNT